MSTPILVTGASSFVGIHTIVQLIERGYSVRGTVRSTAKEAEVREAVEKMGQPNDRLEFKAADLEQDSGWNEAMQSVEYVLHIASPFPLYEPEKEDDLIIPAVQGTLRVLRAAHKAGVKRVVQVSSVAAISAGAPSASTRPWCMTVMRSEMLMTTFMLCSTSTTVLLPCCWIC